MTAEHWTIDDDTVERKRARERQLWLLAARILIPINALAIGLLIGQTL